MTTPDAVPPAAEPAMEVAYRGLREVTGEALDAMLAWHRGSHGPIAIAAYESLVTRLNAYRSQMLTLRQHDRHERAKAALATEEAAARIAVLETALKEVRRHLYEESLSAGIGPFRVNWWPR